ncbi:hypothetical protein [Delftia tsuruhatensis]|uniref:hypothetical protein n=1 Tax=Delftia tsuruhatensis TaxID=180282 RepID=UPI0008ED64CB|nr:hypothetical protein [Delftia tsuruhatensis]SFB29077.1 hypothetical protein SAMN05444579_103581 [Delftia tsuruhatensis]
MFNKKIKKEDYICSDFKDICNEVSLDSTDYYSEYVSRNKIGLGNNSIFSILKELSIEILKYIFNCIAYSLLSLMNFLKYIPKKYKEKSLDVELKKEKLQKLKKINALNNFELSEFYKKDKSRYEKRLLKKTNKHYINRNGSFNAIEYFQQGKHVKKDWGKLKKYGINNKNIIYNAVKAGVYSNRNSKINNIDLMTHLIKEDFSHFEFASYYLLENKDFMRNLSKIALKTGNKSNIQKVAINAIHYSFYDIYMDLIDNAAKIDCEISYLIAIGDDYQRENDAIIETINELIKDKDFVSRYIELGYQCKNIKGRLFSGEEDEEIDVHFMFLNEYRENRESQLLKTIAEIPKEKIQSTKKKKI